MPSPTTKSPQIHLSPAELDEFLTFGINAVETAGVEVSLAFRRPLSIENKLDVDRFDPVTQADRRGEEIIRAGIEASYPSHGILGEEFGSKQGNGLTWVIDPIDGTKAFMTGMLHWGVLLALFDGEQPVIGLMYQPFTRELFWGTNDRAGYRRDDASEVLRARSCPVLADAVLMATSPYFNEGRDLDGFNLVRDAVKMTRFGGDCYLFAMLAMGQIDLGIEVELNAYDIQPMIPIIRGAGGIVTDWQGGDASMGGPVVASGDVQLHAAVLDLLSSVG